MSGSRLGLVTVFSARQLLSSLRLPVVVADLWLVRLAVPFHDHVAGVLRSPVRDLRWRWLGLCPEVIEGQHERSIGHAEVEQDRPRSVEAAVVRERYVDHVVPGTVALEHDVPFSDNRSFNTPRPI